MPVVEPVFPRYLFVRLDFGVTNLAPIRSTLGVSDLVRFGEQRALLLMEMLGKQNRVTVSMAALERVS